MLASGTVSWRSAKQTLAATYTMEAEFISCFEATSHGVGCLLMFDVHCLLLALTH